MAETDRRIHRRAPSMLGCRSGFVQMVREKNPSVTAIHCVIHRQTLAAKILPKELNDVLKLCIKIKYAGSQKEICKEDYLNFETKKPGVHVALAYLSDIFESLNTLNLKLQGGESNIIFHRVAIKAFTDRLQQWKCKILACNYYCFHRLFGILEEARFHNDFKDTDTKIEISKLIG
ncbi:protein FAM200B-like [Schistocerca nitens]|uniref:protein FAM200B-like n=1 Tax=Schistocerca nitens TaxID=7011 RepID=UPI00211817EF|nr:protein FAM200B-like [Schistocerca nitens]